VYIKSRTIYPSFSFKIFTVNRRFVFTLNRVLRMMEFCRRVTVYPTDNVAIGLLLVPCART